MGPAAAPRRWVIALGAWAVVAAVLGGCSSGATPPVSATGSIRCSGVDGSVGFSPPLTVGGSGPEHVTVTVQLHRCSTSGSNVPVVSRGTATLGLSIPTSACAGLVQFPSSTGDVSTPTSSRTLTIRTSWTPAAVRPSELTFSGFVTTVDQSGDVGFAFPGKGHRAVMSGSFTGSDRGALSTASIVTAEQPGQISAACSQLGGLGSIAIVSGEVTFG